MEPSQWVTSLANHLLETIVVVQAMVIFYLFRLVLQGKQDILELVKSTSKLQSELQVATNKSVDAGTNAISEILDFVKRQPWRDK